MEKNKNYCIAPLPFLFKATIMLQAVAMWIALILLAVVLIKAVVSSRKKDDLAKGMFWQLLLWMLVAAAFTIAPFNSQINYLLAYVVALSMLFFGLAVGKKAKLFKITSGQLLLVGLLILLFFSLYLFKVNRKMFETRQLFLIQKILQQKGETVPTPNTDSCRGANFF